MCNCDNGFVYDTTHVWDGADITKVGFCSCRLGARRKYFQIPDEALNWTFATYPNNPKWRDRVQALVDTDKWIVLAGSVGTGKTSLAVSAFKALRDKGERGHFWNTARLMDAAKDAIGDEDKVDPLKKYERDYLLVLDGLGERKLTPWEAEHMAQLLGQRYSYRLRTIITTNWDKKDFDTVLGDWVMDRLFHVGEFIAMDGNSMRRAA